MQTVHRPLTLWLLAHSPPQTFTRSAPTSVRPRRRPSQLRRDRAADSRAGAREVSRVYRELGVEVRWIAPFVELGRPSDILNETLIATVHLGCSSATCTIAPSMV
jgi:hypothetical protein